MPLQGPFGGSNGPVDPKSDSKSSLGSVLVCTKCQVGPLWGVERHESEIRVSGQTYLRFHYLPRYLERSESLVTT